MLDDATRQHLESYLSGIRALENEAAKTHHFAGLVSQLFPGTSAPIELSKGIEKRVRIDLGDREKRGRIDAYYGNAVIEFENSLAATEATALKQLREYTAGVWAGGFRPISAIATDGVVWKVFVPRLKRQRADRPRPSDVDLGDPVRTIELSEATLREFWIWLTSLLFRKGQIEPTAERFSFDFGVGSPAFHDAIEGLRDAWKVASKSGEPRLAFNTWQQYLSVTYGELPEDAVYSFLKHTYLASVARLLVWASISKGRTKSTALGRIAREVLSGAFFKKEKIDNFVEDDFFQWVRRPECQQILSPILERALDQILTYDLRGLNQDVLKGVYQELVSAETRHELGEYYTPDWLCERVVADLLPDTGFPRILDPTCGSGSFLRAAIAHLLAANPSGGDATRLRAVLQSVVGIDIHPLAVTIAKATYLLAVRDLLKATKRSVQIPVYLADSLFLPGEIEQMNLGSGPTYAITFGQRQEKSVAIPDELVSRSDYFDPSIAAAARIAVDHARDGKESRTALRNYLEREVPEVLKEKRASEILDALWELTEELADLIKRKRNSIWAFVVRNAYRPAMIKGSFDFIIGNPPWLSYRYISDPDYQREVTQRAVEEYRIAPKTQRLRTQMELATVFLIHSLSTFGKTESRLAFVMPRSVFSADQHENLRLQTYNAPISIDGYLDLMGVAPVFNVPCCVLFASRSAFKVQKPRLVAVSLKGRLPRRDIALSEAESLISESTAEARVIYLGSRTAWSTRTGRTVENPPSPYKRRFRQGATLVPRNFYFVTSPDFGESLDPDGLYFTETDPEQAAEAKAPYRDVEMAGEVEGRFFFATALSKHLLPFAVVDPATLVLPIDVSDGEIRMITSGTMKQEGFRNFAEWMVRAEEIWASKRGKKADRQSVYERLDYQRELTSQDLNAKHLVLYNAAGTHLAASVFDTARLNLPFVVEHKLYSTTCETRNEALYLASVLNARTINEEIKPFQTFGLMGERDIEKKVLELPIPLFDSESDLHMSLAALGKEAESRVAKVIQGTTLPGRLGSRRALIRDAIEELLSQIDQAVARLF